MKKIVDVPKFNLDHPYRDEVEKMLTKRKYKTLAGTKSENLPSRVRVVLLLI